MTAMLYTVAHSIIPPLVRAAWRPRVEGLHHKRAGLALVHDIAGGAGRRVAHCCERQIALRLTDANEGAVAREFFDDTFDGGARAMRCDKPEEHHGLVDRVARHRAATATTIRL